MEELKKLTLQVLPGEMAVWKLPPDALLPSFGPSKFWSVTRTDEELSVISESHAVPPGLPSEKGWRCIGVKGPLSFDLVGIVAALSAPLAEAGISIFVVSTFDTDYLLVKDHQIELACAVLVQAGHEFPQ